MNWRPAGGAALLVAAVAILVRIAAAYMNPALRKAIAFSGLGLC